MWEVQPVCRGGHVQCNHATFPVLVLIFAVIVIGCNATHLEGVWGDSLQSSCLPSFESGSRHGSDSKPVVLERTLA